MIPKTPILTSMAVLGLGSAQASTVLFDDTFDRSDSTNIDASVSGISGTVGSTFTGDDVYSEPHTAGGGRGITSNELRLATGPGTSNVYVNHNFTEPTILTDGGFSVSLDFNGFTKDAGAADAFQFGGAFAVGMTAAEAASAGDALNGGTGPTAGNKMTNAMSVGQASSVAIADFWVGLRVNGDLVWGSGDAPSGDPQATGITWPATIRADFYFSDFNAGTNVNVSIFADDVYVGSDSFMWSDNDANYIGIDGRDPNYIGFDNFNISTVPEPGIALLGGLSLLGLLRRRR